MYVLYVAGSINISNPIIVETSYKWTKEALLAMNEARAEGDPAAAEARQLSGHRRLSGALAAS